MRAYGKHFKFYTKCHRDFKLSKVLLYRKHFVPLLSYIFHSFKHILHSTGNIGYEETHIFDSRAFTNRMNMVCVVC